MGEIAFIVGETPLTRSRPSEAQWPATRQTGVLLKDLSWQKTNSSSTMSTILRPHSRQGLSDPAAGSRQGHRLHLEADAGPVAAHGGLPQEPQFRTRCPHRHPVQELRAFLHGRAGDLDGRLHHRRHFPHRNRRNRDYVLEHSGASLLFVGKLDTWNQQEPGVPAGLPRIAFPLAPRTDYDTWDSIASRTEPMGGHPARAPDDTAMIIYTSGSTGQPKGVMHCFENITRASEGITADIKSRIGNLPENRIMSYLPLAHVFERAWVECASLIDGNTRVYFAETLDTFLADLNRARPHHLHLGASSVAEVPAGRVHQDAAQEAGPPAQHPHPGPHRRPQGAQGPGSGSGAAGRQRLGTDPGRPDRLVPSPRA
jgi:hypothetical protein